MVGWVDDVGRWIGGSVDRRAVGGSVGLWVGRRVGRRTGGWSDAAPNGREDTTRVGNQIDMLSWFVYTVTLGPGYTRALGLCILTCVAYLMGYTQKVCLCIL